MKAVSTFPAFGPTLYNLSRFNVDYLDCNWVTKSGYTNPFYRSSENVTGSSSFNPSNMLTVDLMHEIELGTWKSTFTHLIHLLYAAKGGKDELIIELNSR